MIFHDISRNSSLIFAIFHHILPLKAMAELPRAGIDDALGSALATSFQLPAPQGLERS